MGEGAGERVMTLLERLQHWDALLPDLRLGQEIIVSAARHLYGSIRFAGSSPSLRVAIRIMPQL